MWRFSCSLHGVVLKCLPSKIGKTKINLFWLVKCIFQGLVLHKIQVKFCYASINHLFMYCHYVLNLKASTAWREKDWQRVVQCEAHRVSWLWSIIRSLNAGSWSRCLVQRKTKASLLQHKHLKLSLFSHHKQRHPVPTQHQKRALLLSLPLVYTPIHPHTQLCDHRDMQNVTFCLNHDEAWVCQFLKLAAYTEGILSLISALMNAVQLNQSGYLTRRWIWRQKRWAWVRQWRSQNGRPR